MTDEPATHSKEEAKSRRAEEFASNLAATGLTKSEFAKMAGFTRNVIYNLSIGQAPSSPEQATKLAAAFEKLKRP